MIGVVIVTQLIEFFGTIGRLCFVEERHPLFEIVFERVTSARIMEVLDIERNKDLALYLRLQLLETFVLVSTLLF